MPGFAKENLVAGLRAAGAITCDSANLARNIEELAGLPSGRVAMIQWGVDTSIFTPPSSEPTALAVKLGVDGQPVVLSPRHFTPLYNLETVISGFRRVVDTIPNAILLMKRYSAEPEYELSIRKQIRELQLERSVYILERVEYDQMPEFYRTGKVLVSVPYSDATPMSMLEGMACGCVPIMSDLPSVREWVQDGWNGQIVSPRDADALARAIIRVLRNPDLARIYAKRNFDLVKQKASQKINMKKMERIYAALNKGTRS
jgi:glycosyltransferase involved in cell wall biosynthesis